jgi:hypothetical protein
MLQRARRRVPWRATWRRRRAAAPLCREPAWQPQPQPLGTMIACARGSNMSLTMAIRKLHQRHRGRVAQPRAASGVDRTDPVTLEILEIVRLRS